MYILVLNIYIESFSILHQSISTYLGIELVMISSISHTLISSPSKITPTLSLQRPNLPSSPPPAAEQISDKTYTAITENFNDELSLWVGDNSYVRRNCVAPRCRRLKDLARGVGFIGSCIGVSADRPARSAVSHVAFLICLCISP